MPERGEKTFLVIEDSADDALLIARAFNGLSTCRAFITRNLSEAKAYLHGAGMYQNREMYPLPNAVMTDLHLGMDSGMDFLKWIKASVFAAMPVIVLTGTANTSEAKAAKAAGAMEVLRKPARMEDLQAMLEDLATKLCG